MERYSTVRIQVTTLLKSAPIVEQSIAKLQKDIELLKLKGHTPTMKVILVGDHPPSLIYTRNKKKFCQNIGAVCEIVKLSQDISKKDFIKEVQNIAEDPRVHGCFVQLPLPIHLNEVNVGDLIPEEKDVDGFNQYNITGLFRNVPRDQILLPCTPKGIIKLLDFYDIEIQGKNVAIIGRSLIVGKPTAILFDNLNATVTLCHSHTANLKKITHNSDIIVTAIGKPLFLTKEYINPDRHSVLIDVGINRNAQGKLCGDIHFEEVKDLARAITPVPGGVGPMTILSLAENLVEATQKITGNNHEKN